MSSIAADLTHSGTSAAYLRPITRSPDPDTSGFRAYVSDDQKSLIGVEVLEMPRSDRS